MAEISFWCLTGTRNNFDLGLFLDLISAIFVPKGAVHEALSNLYCSFKEYSSSYV